MQTGRNARPSIKQSLIRVVRRWGLFEYTAAILLCLGIAAGIYLLWPKKDYVTVVVRVSNRDRQNTDQGAPHLLESNYYRTGIEGKDVLGRIDAKIVSVDSYPHTKTQRYRWYQAVDLTLQLAANHNKARNAYKYRGVNLLVGDWIRLEVGPVLVEGIITDVNNQFGSVKQETLKVETVLKTEDPMEGTNFMETTGVDGFIADAIKVGDMMTDVAGEPIARVTAKRVEAARTVSSDLYGNLLDRPHPRKKDVYLSLDVQVKDVGGKYFFLDGQPVKVNSKLPLFLNSIDIEPRITAVLTP